jgi:GT2 family glycosyltransferase
VEDAYAGKPVADLRPFSLFGVSGCVAMIRRAAAREVHPQGLLFTERLHTYKEDVDLAYRLRGTSWTNGVCHEAVAWHQRAVRPEGRFRRRIGRREAQSYLNHWRLAFWYWRASEWLNPLWIPYEGAKALWYLVRSPRVLVGALGQAWVFARERLAKRSIVG